MSHLEIIELMQSMIGFEIDNRARDYHDRRSMLKDFNMKELIDLMNWTGSFHPHQMNPENDIPLIDGIMGATVEFER